MSARHGSDTIRAAASSRSPRRSCTTNNPLKPLWAMLLLMLVMSFLGKGAENDRSLAISAEAQHLPSISLPLTHSRLGNHGHAYCFQGVRGGNPLVCVVWWVDSHVMFSHPFWRPRPAMCCKSGIYTYYCRRVRNRPSNHHPVSC
jgi:hypothetical protein